MPIEVIMPKVDMDMSSGKIVAWHVAPGDKVEKGTPLFDIETDKAAMEVEAPASGILHHPVTPGADIPIGEPVAWLYDEGEPVSRGDAPEREPIPMSLSTGEKSDVGEVAGVSPNKVLATPLARKLAGEAGISLQDLKGTGARGRVQADDVRAALELRSAPMPVPRLDDDTDRLSIDRAGGNNGTPIVLLHGFASDSRSWGPLEKELGGRPVIRIDLPCHGRSPTRRINNFAALTADIRTAFDQLKIEQKVHLVGHSLGGALAMALADTREQSIENLTLIAPAGLGPEIENMVLDGIGRASKAESLTPWLNKLVADEALITENYVQAAMMFRKDPTVRAAQQALAEILFPDGVQAFDLRATLRRLTVPTRMIWGKRDAIIPWRHALQAPGSIALHLFEDLGHLPQIEAPHEVGKILCG